MYFYIAIYLQSKSPKSRIFKNVILVLNWDLLLQNSRNTNCEIVYEAFKTKLFGLIWFTLGWYWKLIGKIIRFQKWAGERQNVDIINFYQGIGKRVDHKEMNQEKEDNGNISQSRRETFNNQKVLHFSYTSDPFAHIKQKPDLNCWFAFNFVIYLFT